MGRREGEGRESDGRGQRLGCDLWPVSRTLLCNVSGCVFVGGVCVCVCACVCACVCVCGCVCVCVLIRE